MSDNIYFDGVESVGVIGGNVRLELFRYVPDTANSGNAKQSVNKRVSAGSLVMSLEAFLRTHQSMDRLMGELKERNVVTQKQPAAEQASPNFSATDA